MVKLELGRDRISGKRVQITRRKNEFGEKFKSAREANAEATRLKREYQVNGGYAGIDLTYEEFIDKNFLPAYEVSVQRSTFSSRKPTLEMIKSKFKGIKLRDIEVSDVEKFRIWLLKSSGYSQSYASLTFGLFKKSLDYAVRLKLIPKNIAQETKSISKGKTHINIWTKVEFEKVVSSISTNDFYENMCFVMIFLYYMTGLRVGEGQALRWSDIDLKEGRLKVAHTIDFRNRHDFVVKNFTKTASGMRNISIDPKTVSILKRWKKRQEKYGLNSFVLSYDGLPLHRSTVQRIIRRYAKKAGVKPLQGKELRHSHVSYLINELNADILTISQRVGHASPATTLKYYSHLWPKNDAILMKKMADEIAFDNSEASPIEFHGNQNVKSFPANSLSNVTSSFSNL